MEDVQIKVKGHLKYLGPTLDSGWHYEQHFEVLASCLERTAAALGRFLSNIGGPDVIVQRLYARVIRFMALYGAPVWAEGLMATRRAAPDLQVSAGDWPSGCQEDIALSCTRKP